MADEQVALKPRSYWHEAFKSIGLIYVHTWYDSHGNGGQETWQKPGQIFFADRNDPKVPATTLCYNREGLVTGFWERSENKHYLKAAKIEGFGEHTLKLVQVGNEKTSACCTSGSYNVIEEDNHGNDKRMGWCVFLAAGHPTHAIWVDLGFDPLILKRFRYAKDAWYDVIEDSEFADVVDDLPGTRWKQTGPDEWQRTFCKDWKHYRVTVQFKPGEKDVVSKKLEPYTLD